MANKGLKELKELMCSSCSIRISNLPGSARFKCPKCAKSEIIRCPHCRKVGVKYKCPSCGFEGPN